MKVKFKRQSKIHMLSFSGITTYCNAKVDMDKVKATTVVMKVTCITCLRHYNAASKEIGE